MLSVLCTGCAKRYAVSESPTFELNILQQKFHTLVEQHFFLKNGFLRVEEGIFLNNTPPNKKKTYLKKLSAKDKNDLYKIIVDKKILELNDDYNIYLMGGFAQWDISVTLGGSTKKIHICNEKVPEIDALFEAINKLTPKNKPKIMRVYYK